MAIRHWGLYLARSNFSGGLVFVCSPDSFVVTLFPAVLSRATRGGMFNLATEQAFVCRRGWL
jgi:hypothetical protein